MLKSGEFLVLAIERTWIWICLNIEHQSREIVYHLSNRQRKRRFEIYNLSTGKWSFPDTDPIPLEIDIKICQTLKTYRNLFKILTKNAIDRVFSFYLNEEAMKTLVILEKLC